MLPDFRIRQRDYLLEITRAMTRELNLDKLLSRIVDIAAEMLAGHAGLIALRHEDGRWEVAAAHGIPQPFLKYLKAFFGQVQYREDPLRTEVPEITKLIQGFTEISGGLFTTYVGLPLVAFERFIGVIYIFRNYPSVFSNNDRSLLQAFADQAAIAVNNAQLFTQVSREKQRMDALLDTVADGILIIKPNHIIERCNPTFSKLYGMSISEITGKLHEDIIRWQNRDHGITLEEAEIGGWPLTAEATLYVEGDLDRPSETPLPVGITYAPLISDSGNLLNIIATMRDISHFREAEELKSTFISVVSHELKTPVALIKGYVSTLRREDVKWDPEIVDDSLQVIEEEADRLGELIENLLDASRLEAGGLKLNLADIQMQNLIQRMVDRFKTQTSIHTFKVSFPDKFPAILADEDRMMQVVSNLLSNAIKYSPDGGEIEISGKALNDQIIICVSDEGSGIPFGDAIHIFDRFYRAYEASRTTKGAGLGLYLTRALIEAHKGRIWVDTKYDKGARICFSLPRI